MDEIKNVPLAQIIPYENNPRDNDNAVNAVAESIAAFGWKQPIVLDKNNVIIVGHTRYKAAMKLGYEKAPCIVADDLTEDQARAYRLADNKTGEAAEWDFDLLAEELDKIEDYDMTLFNFDNVDFFDDEGEAPEIKEIELVPFKKVHYLITTDLNNHDKIIPMIEEFKKMEGVEIESSLN